MSKTVHLAPTGNAGSQIFISGNTSLRYASDLRARHAPSMAALEVGGAYRDRTDDLKLAKLALSQLSYGPVVLVEIVDGGPGKT